VSAKRERAEQKRASPIFFVYQLLDGDRPFYVGCTSSDTRLKSHLIEASRGTGGKDKNAVILRILSEGRQLKWRKIAEGLTHDQALKIEAQTILKMLRGPDPIANKLLRTEMALLKDRIAVLEKENEQLRLGTLQLTV
jgi:hypothetical protein